MRRDDILELRPWLHVHVQTAHNDDVLLDCAIVVWAPVALALLT